MSELETDWEADEVANIVRWRRRQALETGGFTRIEARIWAEATELDVGKLRELVKAGCPPELLAKIQL